MNGITVVFRPGWPQVRWRRRSAELHRAQHPGEDLAAQVVDRAGYVAPLQRPDLFQIQLAAQLHLFGAEPAQEIPSDSLPVSAITS